MHMNSLSQPVRLSVHAVPCPRCAPPARNFCMNLVKRICKNFHYAIHLRMGGRKSRRKVFNISPEAGQLICWERIICKNFISFWFERNPCLQMIRFYALLWWEAEEGGKYYGDCVSTWSWSLSSCSTLLSFSLHTDFYNLFGSEKSPREILIEFHPPPLSLSLFLRLGLDSVTIGLMLWRAGECINRQTEDARKKCRNSLELCASVSVYFWILTTFSTFSPRYQSHLTQVSEWVKLLSVLVVVGGWEWKPWEKQGSGSPHHHHSDSTLRPLRWLCSYTVIPVSTQLRYNFDFSLYSK